MQPNSHQHNESKIGVGEGGFSKIYSSIACIVNSLSTTEIGEPIGRPDN